MNVMWLLFCVALTGVQLGYGLPLGTPHTYPQDVGGTGNAGPDSWYSESALYAAVPALALVLAAVGLLFGCTWCYRHKDCKNNNQGNDNQLFTASVSQLHDASRRAQPDSGFSEPVNNNISEDNNNGPISLREMQNIANNNAAVYIVSENEERNRMSRESVVEFEPLPEIGVPDPLERYADWFGNEDFPRDRLQYLREIGRGWFGRIVQGEVEGEQSSAVAVKILKQDASSEDKARFLDEARVYRDLRHENLLALVAKCLQEEPWILVFELCHTDLRQYLVSNRPNMAELIESGAPLRLACDVTSALAYLHERGFLYGNLNADTVLVRGAGAAARGVLGRYAGEAHRAELTAADDVAALGVLLWEAWAWGAPAPAAPPLPAPAPAPAAPSLYADHVYQVMQVCWRGGSARQALELLQHLRASRASSEDLGSEDFELRWQRLKPNCRPVVDEHVALVHAPSSSSHLNPLAEHSKSPSMTNLHGSLEDVRNIYLTHNEAATLECNQANENLETPHDLSDSSVDPWLKDIIAGSQDDVSYYKDVSDVIKNLDNILNSEKTSSSESSHQASPSRDNLSLDCKRELPVPSSLVKSPGIRNFQDLETEFGDEEPCVEEEDRETVGTLSHSFERHSDTTSQHTLANLTPDTPNKEFELTCEEAPVEQNIEAMPKDKVVSEADVCLDVSEYLESEVTEGCQTCDIVGAKTYHLSLEPLVTQSVDDITSEKETDRSSAGVTEIPLEETKLDSQGNVSIDIENLDETVSSEFPLISRSIAVESCVQIESQAADSIRSLTEEFLLDQINHASAQAEDRINDNVPREPVNNEEVTSFEEINHNEIPEFIDVIHESEMIVDSVIKEATEALTPKQIEQTCSNGIDHELNEAPVAMITVPSEDNTPNKDDESTLVETINEVTDIKESNDSHSPLINPSVHLSPSKFRDDDVTDVSESIEDKSLDTASTLPIGSIPDLVQTNITQQNDTVEIENRTILASTRIPNESTIYMDLINTTAVQINKNDTMSNTVKEVINNCVENAPADETECTLVRQDSTAYMDLPSVIHTRSFLHAERAAHRDFPASAELSHSTPKNEDVKKLDNQEQCKATPSETGVAVTTQEQRCGHENISPFDSPTRSHPTETYDENSSIVLGSLENCSLELFKAHRSVPADIEIPKEELLAFSSNFSELNLATPSPLRDVNFLNEVPDIEVNEAKEESITDTEQKRQLDFCESENSIVHGPSTPPNSPGNFLASSQKHAEPLEVHREPEAGVSSSREEVDLSQIELVEKLAMAENENNMNIEYSGPLIVESVSDDIPESYLAGNGGRRSPPAELALDEDCMRALRDELELKLPLAQVASIEPTEELEPNEELEPSECEAGSGESWRAAELVVSYLGALSPIAEETGGQLSAYENDLAWNTSTRTDSSSYLEPCNNSTDEPSEPPSPPATDTATDAGIDAATDSPAGTDTAPRTDSAPSGAHTYTVQPPSKQVTDMSADSLNSSPARVVLDAPSPNNDRTYNLDDQVPCELISQVSPFLLSPSDTSAPEDTEVATGAFTLSTVPTEIKPSETPCLSKAISIDSWCSNDTLFNVEEDFDDLADVNIEFDNKDGDNSESTHTLNDKEPSHCSTYIVHDDPDKSECDSFTPDSITANQTYTKPKLDETPLVVLSSEVNDSSPVNSQTKDLAYGTLTGLTSCTTDFMSTHDELWRFAQPELVRRSPIADETMNLTPPQEMSKNYFEEPSPKLEREPMIKKMDSVEITCLQDDSDENNVTQPLVAIEESQSEEPQVVTEDLQVSNEEAQVVTKETKVITENDQVAQTSPVVQGPSNSPEQHYRNMAHSIQSTPLVEVVDENVGVEGIALMLPQHNSDNTSSPFIHVPNFQMFINSAELRPQDISPVQAGENVTSQDTGLLLESESKVSNQTLALDRTPNYASFEGSAVFKPQEVNTRSSQELSCVSSNEDFRLFENSVRSRPQDLSSIEATSILLQSEIKSSELAMGSSTNIDFDHTSQNFSSQYGVSGNNFDESRVAHHAFNDESEFDENEQPHSIIITESPLTPGANRTYDSHENAEDRTFESHTHRNQIEKRESPHVNGDAYRNPSPKFGDRSPSDNDQSPSNNDQSPKEEVNRPKEDVVNVVQDVTSANDLISQSEDVQSPNNILSSSVNVQSANDTQSLSTPKIDSQLPNGSHTENQESNDAYFATVNFINENFEELMESNVDSHSEVPPSPKEESKPVNPDTPSPMTQQNGHASQGPIENGLKASKSETENFLTNEKMFCQTDGFAIPLLTDIRFTGPASEIMSTSFSEGSGSRRGAGGVNDLLKDWDSDSDDDSRDTNSSSGEFIWKDGDGLETPVVPSYFDHQRDSSHQSPGQGSGGGSEASGDSGSGSEGDEVEFVPSSWDCRAEPAKSSLRSLEQAQSMSGPDGKKRVVFKRQKYHCVYEYPREATPPPLPAAARTPDYCTYAEWDAAASAAAELGYQQLYGALPAPLAAAQGNDYGDDFFISSSARPFESLGLVSSQFFPGLHALKAGVIDPAPAHLYRPPPLSAPALELVTPDSGVEDITPAVEELPSWRAASIDSPSSPEVTTPGSPVEALGGLRHTRDKLKLDLPPSPIIPSPRIGKVFNFTPRTPLVMTDDTPVVTQPALPQETEELPLPEPTFSTFGKSVPRAEPEPAALILAEPRAPPETSAAAEPRADSGDEDSGIESSAKASLERKHPLA